jgi:hypothetical protein
MILSNKVRQAVASYSYLETTVILALYLGIGFWSNPEDICMLKSPLLPMTIMLALITLFHGITNGLFAIAVMGVVMKLNYAEFHYEAFLGQLVLVLIFGEFHYYWNRIITDHRTEMLFTRQKLNELSNVFYALKISHDQIEKSYIVKPMSIRNSIRFIKEEFQNGGESDLFFQKYMQMIEKNFVVKKAVLVHILEDGETKQLAILDGVSDFDEEDPMFLEACEKKMPVYLRGDSHDGASHYLAVIPALHNEKVVGVLAIEEMPFIAFNKDALVSITILTNYLFDEMHKLSILQEIQGFLPEFEDDFRFDLHRLLMMYREFDTQSTLILLRSDDELVVHIYIDLVKRHLRTLESMNHIEIHGEKVVAVLFPFSDISAVEGFLERLGQQMERVRENERVMLELFSLSKIDLIESFIYREL